MIAGGSWESFSALPPLCLLTIISAVISITRHATKPVFADILKFQSGHFASGGCLLCYSVCLACCPRLQITTAGCPNSWLVHFTVIFFDFPSSFIGMRHLLSYWNGNKFYFPVLKRSAAALTTNNLDDGNEWYGIALSVRRNWAAGWMDGAQQAKRASMRSTQEQTQQLYRFKRVRNRVRVR